MATIDAEKSGHGAHTIKPRVIIHGGAGAITRKNLPPHQWRAHRDFLLSVLRSTHSLLEPSQASGSEKPSSGATALEAAVHAVALLEDEPMFNCARGAVFTRAGTIELEASVMVSDGYRKRGCGVMMLTRVKNPIKLAAEMLKRGNDVDGKGGGAYGHGQLAGEQVEALAEEWGREMCENKYFWTKKRWEEHKKGLDEGWANGDQDSLSWPPGEPGWDGREYLPQGTVGCVVLDRFGTICAATSTGGITNKLPGRIGDTPTFGAGFWAEEWSEQATKKMQSKRMGVLRNLANLDPFRMLSECLGSQLDYNRIDGGEFSDESNDRRLRHAVGMSGTGNGDSFLRLSAVRTAAAMSRFSTPCIPLAEAVAKVAGSGGELQKSAGDRWEKTGEGEGGIIGIELVGKQSTVVWDFNCGGMFRAYMDVHGRERCMVFKEDY